MRIERIVLHDIKCFPHFEAAFAPGINFICGKNGAGKTTLVEAIGLAVCGAGDEKGYVDYFLRDGARSGEIRVDIHVSGETYSILRRIKKNASGRRILDAEGNELDLHGDQDVDDFLKERLGIGPRQSLSRLFTEVVGVRQGMLTQPFREQPAERKRIFNAMLGVERYKQAALRLPELSGYIQDKLSILNTQQAVLASHTAELPALKNALANMDGRKIAAKAALERIDGECQAAQECLNSLAKKQQAYDALLRETEAAKAAYLQRAKGHQAAVNASGQALLTAKESAAAAYDMKTAAEKDFSMADAELKALAAAKSALDEEISLIKQSAEAELSTLEQVVATRQAALDQLQQTAGRAKDGRCPYLDIPCTSVTSLDEAITKRHSLLSLELSTAKEAALECKARFAAKASQAQARLEVLLAREREAQNALANAQAALVRGETEWSLHQAAIARQERQQAALQDEERALLLRETALKKQEQQLAQAAPIDPSAQRTAQETLVALHGQLGTAKEQFAALQREAAQLQASVTEKAAMELELKSLNEELRLLTQCASLCASMGQMLRGAGSRAAQAYRERISLNAQDLYHRLSGDGARLIWAEDYEVLLLDRFMAAPRTRSFRQLSGGEQMSVALALRLSLLAQLSPLGVAFFDEPTANLDASRREGLARLLPRVTAGFEQVFLISHDDTFDAISDHVLEL